MEILGGEKLSPKLPHSIPVPYIYKTAANILQQHCEGKGSIRRILYDKPRVNHRKLFAIVSKVISKYSSIKNALTKMHLFEEQPNFNQYLAFVLTSELVGRKGPLPGGYKPAVVLNSYEEKLRELLPAAEFQSCYNVTVSQPRYARINTNLTTENEVYLQLKYLGFELVEYDSSKISYDGFLKLVQIFFYLQKLRLGSFTRDYHIPTLLVFHERANFWGNELWEKNYLYLQNKGSCIPAFVSGVKPGSDVIDSCAAPGSKTLHLANMMNNTGNLISVDKCPERFKTLTKLLKVNGVKCVTALNKDFTSLNPLKFSAATTILVDPSCSSSGTSVHKDTVSQDRIHQLASFQLAVLSHALSFPNVKSVIYSTCSINEEENEQVVERALEKAQDLFEIEDLSKLLSDWKNFGLSNYEFGSKCIRTVPSLDKCDGFFVAKFIKKLEGNRPKKKLREKKKKHATLSRVTDEGISDEMKRGGMTNLVKKRLRRQCKKRKFAEFYDEIITEEEATPELIEGEKISKKKKKKS